MRVKPENRTHDLMTSAATRLARLVEGKKNADKFSLSEFPMSRAERRHLEYNNELSESPIIVQFAYYSAKYSELKKEIAALSELKNKRKRDFESPMIEKELKETENRIRDLYVLARGE